MAQLTDAEIDRVIDNCLAPMRRAMRKAMGASGFGAVTVEFKNWKPKIETLNRDREPIDEDPEN